MKTQIFADYYAFLARSDKNQNGVSAEFAKDNPEYLAQNESNEACWNCSYCSYCSYCSSCSSCSYCSYCSDCSSCSEKTGDKKTAPTHWSHNIPVIPNIHQTILEAVTGPGALDMGDWHRCETTHCRAGWAVHKAGPAGYALEKATSTAFAAMMIYKASSPIAVPVTRFFGSNDVAMADIKRCAAEEAAAGAK